jgi:small subunit ribosomal protein S16
MVVIRLARTGRNKYPTYRVVAAESARPVTGKFIAIIGHYNPHTKELSLKKDQAEKFLNNGAQPSNSVIKLLQQQKVNLPEWVQLKTKHRAAKGEPTPDQAVTASSPDASAEPAAKTDDESESGAPEHGSDDAVATTAAETSESVEDQAPAGTNLDSDHIDTAASETEQADKASQGEDAAAQAALDVAKDQTKNESSES